MSSSHSAFKIPPGQPIGYLKLINPVNFGPAVLKGLMGPPISYVTTLGPESDRAPSLSFFIEHSSGRRLVWDLGIRKDWQAYAPVIAKYIPTRNYKNEVDKNDIEILEEEGISGKSIEAVIWR
jgi:hypothetical protein